MAALHALVPTAAAEDARASRLAAQVHEVVTVPVAGLTTVLSLNEAIAEVVAVPTGFELRAKAAGETLVQAFTAQTVAVFVVTIRPVPVPVPAPGPPTLGERGAIDSFWGANQYTAQFQRSSGGDWYSQQGLDFRGRARRGEYQASLQYFLGSAGHQLQQASLAWQNEDRSLAFDLGDTAGRVEGTTMLGAVGMKGLLVRRQHPLGETRGELAYEAFVGSLRGPADPEGLRFRQPVGGAALQRSWQPTPRWRLRLGTSLLGYSTATTPLGPGQAGMVAGSSLRAFHDRGLSGELRAALSLTRAALPRAAGQGAGSIGATLQQASHQGGARVDLEASQPGFAQPQSTQGLPGSRRLTTSVNRQINVVQAAASASYTRVEYPGGVAGNALAYRLNVAAPLRASDRVALHGGRSDLVLPPLQAGPAPMARAFRQTLAGARLEHTFDHAPLDLQAELNYLATDSGDSASQGGTAGIAMQRHRRDGWEAAGALTVAVAQVSPRPTDRLASDEPSLNVGASLTAQGRIIQGPFESFGGLGLQATAMPAARLSPSANLGVQFTPTSAHRLVATATLARYTTGQTPWTVGLGYTHHFGDAVRARPLLEFLRVGRLAGRVCFDEDQDGQCAPSEPSLANVAVRLSDGRTTTTDAQGNYAFENLKPGYYHVEADEAALRREGRPTTVLSHAFALEPRAERALNFGIARACRVRGHVVNDLDLDGEAASDEPLFGRGAVTLTGAPGEFHAPVNAQGTFAITLPCGEYAVELDPAALPELHSPGDRVPIPVVVTPDHLPTVRLLVRAIRTIAGVVYLDANDNGQRDPGEAGQANVVVRFGRAVGRTDGEGNFLLRRVPAGTGALGVDPASLPPDLEAGPAQALTLPPTPAALEDRQLPVRRRP